MTHLPALLKRRYAALLVTVALGGACEPAAPPIDPAAHRADVEQWRTARYAQLTDAFGPEGWLSLVGLYWLEEGASSFGTGDGNDVVFPEGSGPDRIGVFTWSGEEVRMDVEDGLQVRHNGNAIRSLDLSRSAEQAPMVDLGTLRWHAIKRGDRFGIRLKDSASPVLTGFDGIDHFDVVPEWRITARFDRYDPPKSIRVPNVIGTENDQPSPGAVVFRVGGRRYRLDVTGRPDDEAFFVTFGDSTNALETYGGGRYVWVDAPDDHDRLVIDFNKAYNPPCVFTDFATCPLPPRQNRLSLRIAAGEKSYHPTQ